MNFLGDEGADRVRQSYGDVKYDRLQALKRNYHPDNFFRFNQNVLPHEARGTTPLEPPAEPSRAASPMEPPAQEQGARYAGNEKHQLHRSESARVLLLFVNGADLARWHGHRRVARAGNRETQAENHHWHK